MSGAGLLLVGAWTLLSQAAGEPAVSEPVPSAAVPESVPAAASASASAPSLDAPWSRGQAYVLPQGRAEIGMLAPLRYGWRDDLEVSTHPLLDLVMPNVALKKGWGSVAGGVFATRHNLLYPTGLLIALSRAGTGGILPHETRVPSIIAINNEALCSRPLGGGHILTAKLGLMLAQSFGRDTVPTIDLPIVFPRTAAFTMGASGNLGAAISGPLWGPLAYAIDADLFVMADRTSTLAAEGSGLVIWQASDGFRAQLGAMAAFSQLPFGSLWGWMPLVDLIWAL